MPSDSPWTLVFVAKSRWWTSPFSPKICAQCDPPPFSQHLVFLVLLLHGSLSLQGDFREENFNTAMTVLKDAGDAAKGDQRGRRGGIVGKH